jgi:predicted acyltransferase
MNKHIDFGSFIVALITLALFVAALFTKGLSHDLFLEAGVFLVSVKIIIMAYKNSVAVGHLGEKLDKTLAELAKNDQGADADEGSYGRSTPRE